MATVRVPPELNDRLKDHDRGGLSVTAWVVDTIERRLDGRLVEAGSEPARSTSPKPSPGAATQPATVSRAGSRKASSKATGSGCLHPPGRRIGRVCMACGAEVPGR